MADLYHILAHLCEKRQITPYRMCKDTGIQPSVMTDLKMGRRKTVKAERRQGLQITLASLWIICLGKRRTTLRTIAGAYKKS